MFPFMEGVLIDGEAVIVLSTSALLGAFHGRYSYTSISTMLLLID